MWNDNETDVDLLGFDQLVDAAVMLVETDDLLPLTIGAFRDRGSGKSSLMKMIQQRIVATPGYVCVSFSPWQQETLRRREGVAHGVCCDDGVPRPAERCGIEAARGRH